MPSQFIPGVASAGGLILPAGQSTYNESNDLDLIPSSHRIGGTATFAFNPTPLLSLSGLVTASTAQVARLSPPPVTYATTTSVSGVAAPIVPAADNPFGQDVAVGLVHTEFGPLRHRSRSANESLSVGLRDLPKQSLTLEGNLGYAYSSARSNFLDLDQNAFAASLANPDPSLRFNPFGDPASGPINSELYHDLTIERTTHSTSQTVTGAFSGRDQLPAFWGGSSLLKFGAEANARKVGVEYINPANLAAPDADYRRSAAAVSGSLWVPLIGAANPKRLVRRLSVEVAGRFEDEGSAGNLRTQEVGLAYQPAKALTIRLSVNHGEKPPPLPTFTGQSSTVTLVDPRRIPSTVTDVETFTVVDPTLQQEKSQIIRASLYYAPPFIKGMNLALDFKDTHQAHLASQPDAQSIVYNEGFFGSRVVRGAQTAQDIALGQPGAIEAVDTSPGSFGDFSDKNLGLSLSWDSGAKHSYGRFRPTVYAVKTLQNRYELAPGIPYVSDSVGAQSPPDWAFYSALIWLKGPWAGSALYKYTGRFSANRQLIGDDKTLGLTVSFKFMNPIWRKFGNGATLSFGVGDVFNEKPPYADTVRGYLSGTPAGRSCHAYVLLPF